MKFSAAFVVLAAALAPALAPAFAAPTEELQKRENTIYVCTGDDWDWTCITYDPIYNQCQPFSDIGLEGYQSWGPSSGTYCIWYSGAGCTGTASDAFTDPGYAPVPGYWVYNTASFKCWW